MKFSLRFQLGMGLTALCLPACGGGGATAGGSASKFAIIEVSNGFGRLLPHQIKVLDGQGQVTDQVVEVRRMADLLANATRANPILPVTEWPTTARLPNGKPGNHFIYARFTQLPDPETFLSSDASTTPGSIGFGIQVQTVNPVTGELTDVQGRAFVGGQTFGPDTNPNDPNSYVLQTWVQRNGDSIEATTINGLTPGLGCPGTELDSGFAGDTVLVEPGTFLFVIDADNDLTTHETFPVGQQIQMRIGNGARSARGRALEEVGLASSTVGVDSLSPEVLVEAGSQDPSIQPAKDAIDVDPQTDVIVQFTEPVQLLTLGDMADGTPPAPSAAIQLSFGPSSAKVQVPFTVEPVSMLDMTRFRLDPVYDFPGTGPNLPGVPCDTIFGNVEVRVNSAQFDDLSANDFNGDGVPDPNKNALAPFISFTTRDGPGIVNAPVTPDAIYIGRAGSNQGISVIDLNGFGQGTGNPTYDLEHPVIEGSSNFPNNPNVFLSGALLIPPLSPGTCTFNGGSSGPFTLTKDSSLRDILASSPQLESVGDMALGHALDNTFNNEQPFGCQAGGGNLCAQAGLKVVVLIPGGSFTVASANVAPIPVIKSGFGVENLASWAPHPNPPPLSYPPLCLSPLINALEPTSVDSIVPPQPIPPAPPFVRPGPGLRNLLVPGPFPLGIPSIGLPPQSTLAPEQNSFFEGPSTPQPQVGSCHPFMMRQQVGQFLYVVDRAAGEIVVFNSNRFIVLDRIRMSDPTSLAMSPNLDFVAVTNEGADQVTFLDIDPSSPTFHQIIKTTPVGAGPTGIAWESGNEDIFVCNQSEGTVSIISGFTLDVRKTIRNQVTRPIDVALTPRQGAFGFLRGVYFGYILNQNGSVAIFESGPDGINGFGFDDTIATLPFRFLRPKTIQPDPTNLNSGVWIVHESPLNSEGSPTGQGGGAISTVGITGGFVGQIPLDPGPFSSPQLRDLSFSVLASIGEGAGGLSGIPVDIAFDNLRNLSALTNYSTTFSPGNPRDFNGKAIVKVNGVPLQATAPSFMFAAVPNPGVIDVYDMSGGAFDRVDTNAFRNGVQSIPAPNATVLMDYFRQ
ncbi:MAG: hypothetical protein EXS08_08015 [Planctomycetes bacterium]|nr:hypothetical protein [Planctomycetota bacterium]